jgi:DNA ligase-1
MSSYPDGKYIGELTVIVNGVLQDRATGNGLINSDSPPHNDIYLDAWDYVTLDEYNGAANKVKGTTPYAARFARLGEIVSDQTGNVRIIETHIVDSFADALQKCSAWMTAGFEGAILKDKDAIFRDGTSPQQLKLKLEIDAEVRVTGFIEGTPGTKRESTFGSITFATDDGTIKGSCSGFNDTQLEDFNSRREELVGQVFTVQFNDITKGRDNDYHALSHPRFVEFRTDKDETDTLERVLKSKNMAMCIGDTH